MPIQHAIWKLGDTPSPLPTTKLVTEQQLEDLIVQQPSILSEDWMLIGRQEATGLGGRIDLLAIVPDGSLVLIELKRDRTPREVVAQAIDYASWVEALTAEELAQIYRRFSGKDRSLSEAFEERFGTKLDEEQLNATHQIVIVASELDASTERILGYLSARDIAINVLFFQVFEMGSERLLSRAWLLDPSDTQESAVVGSSRKQVGTKESWNGEYYVSFGGDLSWEVARKHGFVSAGGGAWYVRTLESLSPGDRVWVKLPGDGYVGVGRVTEPVQAWDKFRVSTPLGRRPISEVLGTPGKPWIDARPADKAERFVGVAWLDTIPEEQAFDEVGLFGNQNTVCRPNASKWRHTVERLKGVFKNWDGDAAKK